MLPAICLSLLPVVVKGQDPHFEKITEQQGLSDNRVTCFKKDRTGFLWIGTENGLNRYDGSTFRIYRPGQSSFKLSHEHINDIEEDAHGQLWVATWGGLNILDPVTGALTILSPGKGAHQQKKKTLSSALIWDTYIDAQGRVWIAPDVRDLCCYDPSTQEYTYFPWREFIRTTLGDAAAGYISIQKITSRSKHALWLGTTLGLVSFDLSTGAFQYHGGGHNEDCVSLYYDSLRQRVYFGQKDLYVFDAREQQAKKMAIQNTLQPDLSLESAVLIPAASGLWAIHPEKERAEQITPASTAPSVKMKTAYDDHTSFWVGTTDGIRHYDQQLDLFHYTSLFPGMLPSATQNVHHILDHEEDQCYYITSYAQNKLIIVDKQSGQKKEITSIGGKPLINCTRIFEDHQHRLWLLTRDHIFVTGPDRQRFTVLPYPPHAEYNFTDMTEDADGTYWFASLTHGVFQFDPEKKTWRLLQGSDSILSTRPTSLLSDPAHRTVWIGDFGRGVIHYSLDTRTSHRYTTETDEPLRLPSTSINALALDRNGDVWIATNSGGVCKYVQSEKKFIRYSMNTGLPENTVNALQCDHHGNLWLGSFKGLTCMNVSGRIIKHYDQNTGLPFTGFVSPLTVTSKGELLTGVANGYLKFHPDSLRVTTPAFPVTITAVQQGNRTIDPREPLSFPYDQNEFTFQFSALTYTLPQQVTYFYTLEGYDKGWINARNNHSARYTNLGEGHYTFKVKAVDHSGRASANAATVAFMVEPPFWKREWFVGVLLAIVITSIVLWIQVLQRRIRSQKILNQVATSLYAQSTLEDVFWTVAKNCIDLLHFKDCVVYVVQADRGMLVQKAAAGPKSIEPYQIFNPIEIPLGKGIVGTVAQTGKPEIIRNTAKDPRYIIDDQVRFSEIAVPVFIEGRVFGVIDSEDHRKNFYSRWHLTMLKGIAAICSSKIGRYFAEDQIRSKVARDLHDDIGSTLSSIRIMSNIALEKNEPTTALNYLKAILQNATAMQESMSDMVWAINPKNDTLEEVIIRMKEFSAEILEPLNILYDFMENGDLSHVKLDLSTRKDLYLIFKETLNNIVKYSGCNAVMIHLFHTPAGIRLEIEDNGKGFDTSRTYSGNGLHNMRDRAQAIGATLEIESVPSKGTMVRVSIPSHDQGI